MIRCVVLVSMLALTLLSVTHSAEKTNTRPDANATKPYTLKINRYLCTGVPYESTIVNYCKTVLRRNKPTLMNLSVVVPEVLDYIWVTMKMFYKFKTFQPFLIDLEQEGCEYLKNRPAVPLADYIFDIFHQLVPDLTTPCPHGNRTYNLVWWIEERLTPQSLPAGDYRLETKFINHDGGLVFAVDTYFTVRRSGVLRSMIEW